MAQFFIDKNNKIPLYLQLKDQIKYFISTGSLKAEEKLPPVKILAKSLGINFLTVRKAYKELEESGLIDVRHGEGTFISLNPAAQKTSAAPSGAEQQLADAVRRLIEQYSQRGLDFSEIRRVLDATSAEFERSRTAPLVFFAECNNFQVRQISGILETELKLAVQPVLVEDLKKAVGPVTENGRKINIVTTGFHVNEVREAVAGLPVQIDVLITNLNPETRRQLESFGEKASYSFICRDKESAVLYKDLLKAELGYRQMQLTACTLAETEKVAGILNSSDVVLVSPPVYEQVRRLAPPEKVVYNVFERVDPMSLKVVKDRILGA